MTNQAVPVLAQGDNVQKLVEFISFVTGVNKEVAAQLPIDSLQADMVEEGFAAFLDAISLTMDRDTILRYGAQREESQILSAVDLGTSTSELRYAKKELIKVAVAGFLRPQWLEHHMQVYTQRYRSSSSYRRWIMDMVMVGILVRPPVLE